MPQPTSKEGQGAIRILGREYQTTAVAPSAMTNLEMGLCDNKSQNIFYSTDQSELELADTILHETLHAIDYIAGLDMSEHQVRHLAACLVGVLQDNPEFAQWLIKDKNVKPKESNRKRTKRSPRGTR